MGSGDVVYSSSKEGKWQLIEPGSLGQSEWEVACDKEWSRRFSYARFTVRPMIGQ